MNKKIVTIASRLITMEQVRAIEQAMIEFGITDTYSRPLHFAQRDPHPDSHDPLAAVFLTMSIDMDKPSHCDYIFDAGYRIAERPFIDLVQPETFLAMVRFATLLKLGE